MRKSKGSRAEADTGEDVRSKYVRERVFQPNPLMLGAMGKARKRERTRERHTLTNTNDDTEKPVCGVGRKTITITGARCCKWLQPDQSRRWSTELSQEQGTRRRSREEG